MLMLILMLTVTGTSDLCLLEDLKVAHEYS